MAQREGYRRAASFLLDDRVRFPSRTASLKNSHQRLFFLRFAPTQSFESLRIKNGRAPSYSTVFVAQREGYRRIASFLLDDRKRFPSRTASLNNSHNRLLFLTLRALSGFESLHIKKRQSTFVLHRFYGAEGGIRTLV